MKTQLVSAFALMAILAGNTATYAGSSFPSSFGVTVSGFDVNDVAQTNVQEGTVQIDVDPATGDFFTVLDDNSGTPAPGNSGSPFWDVTQLSVSGNIDPRVFLSFNVTNTSLTSSVVMTVTTTLPTGAFGPATLFGGQVSGSILNSFPAPGSGDVTISPAPGGPTALWQGFIDGVPVLDLLDNFTLSAPISANIPTESQGNPVLFPESATIPGPAVASSIGVTQTFLLTPGDTAQFVSTFVVVPVPEPTAALLAGFASIAVAGVRRRS